MPDSRPMTEKAYVGVKPCGCITFVMVPGYCSEREERADLKRVMRSGRRIEIVPASEAKMTWDCPHGSAPQPGDIAAVADQLMKQVRRDD